MVLGGACMMGGVHDRGACMKEGGACVKEGGHVWHARPPC